jgi:hypothetical protein
MADRFLKLAPGDRQAVLRGPASDRLQAYSEWQLAEAKRQANEILRLLDEAEDAWKQTVVGTSDGAAPGLPEAFLFQSGRNGGLID